MILRSNLISIFREILLTILAVGLYIRAGYYIVAPGTAQ